MKKTTRVSLLVFTVVAAIVAFGVLWYTRPGAPSYVLDEAKARQGVPLLEVTEPATQAPPVEIDLDYNTITAKVKENLVEDEGFSAVMAKSVSSAAVSMVDEKMNSFRTEFDAKLSEQQNSILKELSDKISSSNSDLVAQLTSADAYGSQIDLINDKIEKISSALATSNSKMDSVNKSVEEYAAKVNDPSNYSVDLTPYIPQIVDSVIPEVTETILTTIDDNKETIFSDIYEMSDNSISEEEAIAIYNQYRANIVRDLAPAILDQIESQVNVSAKGDLSLPKEFSLTSSADELTKSESVEIVKAAMDAPDTEKNEMATVADNISTTPVEAVAEVPEITPPAPAEAVAEVTPVVSEEPVVEVVDVTPVVEVPDVDEFTSFEEPVETTPVVEETKALVPSKPTFAIEPVVKEVPKIIRTNTINIIAVSDGSSIQDLDKSSDETISLPEFVDSPTVTVMDPSEYEAQRKSIREKAINDILTFIK